MAARDERNESHSEEQRRQLNRFKGISKKTLRENYRLIKNLIEPDNINDELLARALFTKEQHRSVQQSRNTDYKRHNIVKHILRLSESRCFTFFEILHNHTKGKDLETIRVAAGKVIPENISSIHHIQQDITSWRTILVPQLEVHSTTDCLLEYSVITLDEHDQVLEPETRQAQRETLFDIITSKTNWVESFIHILTETGQQGLLKLNSEAPTDTYLDIFYRQDLGNTTQFPGNPADDIVIGITGDQSLEESIMRNINEEAAVIRECAQRGILEIYTGNSIYMYLPFGTNSVNMDNKSEVRQNVLNLLKCITKNCTLYSENPKQQTITVKVLRKPHDSLLNKCYGLPKLETVRGNKGCIRCLSQMIKKNIDVIISEIERDIIEETFSSLTNVSTFTRKACLDKDVSRINRAKRFVMYILQHEDALRSFITVFKEKSKVDIKSDMCEDCSTCEASVEIYHQQRQTLFVDEFTVCININKSDITITLLETILSFPKELTLATKSTSRQGLVVDSRALSTSVEKNKKKVTRRKPTTDYELTVKKRRRSRSVEENEDDENKN